MSRKPKVKWVADVLAWTLLVTGMAAPAGARADELCRLGVLQSISVDDGWLETELRHCFCTDQITLMLNTDRTYEAAYSVELDADLGGFVGAFAERYETDPTEPGGICSFVLYLTDNGRNLRPPVDLYIWEDLEGEPGVVRGIVPNRSTGGLPVYPFFEPHPFDIVDLGQVVSINGSFWVGFATEWVEGGCSLHIGADLNGSGGCGVHGQSAQWARVSRRLERRRRGLRRDGGAGDRHPLRTVPATHARIYLGPGQVPLSMTRTDPARRTFESKGAPSAVSMTSEAARSASASTPVSTPRPSKKKTRSSVPKLPLAPGA